MPHFRQHVFYSSDDNKSHDGLDVVEDLEDVRFMIYDGGREEIVTYVSTIVARAIE
jgi:hypothetical protein